MGYLLKREFRYKRRDVIRDVLVQLAAPALCMAACIFASDALKVFGAYIYMLPEPAYRLLGLEKELNYNYWFYIKVIIMFSNIYIMRNVCKGVFSDVDRDEKNGSIFFMCNQLFSRKAIIISKYIASAASFVTTYILWFAGMMLMGVAAGMKTRNIAGNIKEMLPMMCGGIIIGILLLSFTYIYAVYKRKKSEYRASVFVNFIIFGTLIAGGLYKLKNVVLWIMDYLKKPHPGLFENFEFLDGFRWFSPLSWANPFVVHNMKEWIALTLAAFIISCVSVVCAIFLYEKRTLDY